MECASVVESALTNAKPDETKKSWLTPACSVRAGTSNRIAIVSGQIYGHEASLLCECACMCAVCVFVGESAWV
jgi:hypothetical protein